MCTTQKAKKRDTILGQPDLQNKTGQKGIKKKTKPRRRESDKLTEN